MRFGCGGRPTGTLRARLGPGASFRLALALALAGCGSCRPERTDEEKLRERIDTPKVHLYVAMKIAVTKSGEDGDVALARAALLVALASAADFYTQLGRLSADDARAVEPPDGADLRRVAERAGRSAGDAARRAGELAKDAVALTAALWTLRSVGAEIVRGEREDDLPPVLPILLAESGLPPPLREKIDANAEHALLLSVFFVLKTHPKSPAPVPDEIVLYEASRTDAATLAFVGLRPIVHAVAAWVFGTAELCDLAARQARGIPEQPDDAWRRALAADLALLGDERVDPAVPEDARKLDTLHAAALGMSHGEAAVCYLQREQEPEALRELAVLAEAAERAGVPAEDVAPLRAYLAWKGGDVAAAEAHLRRAVASPRLTPDEREAYEELLGYLARRDARFGRAFDKAFFALFGARLFLVAVERSGLSDRLAATPLVRKARDFATVGARAVGGVQQGAAGLLDGVRARLPGADRAAEEGSP